MNDRTGLITLAAYMTAATAIVVVACLAIFSYGVSSPLSGLDPIPAEPVPEFAATTYEIPPSDATSSTAAAVDQQRIRVLEGLLAEKTQRLRKLSQSLMKQNKEYEDLNRRYEDAVYLASQTLGAPAATNTPAASSKPESAPTSQSEVERTQLEGQLAMARAVHEATLNDLEMLEDELTRVYDELGQTREEADQEATNRLREALVLEAATAGVMLRVGKDAVPALKDAMNHNSPIVRRWAATVLGGIGADAGDAVTVLTEALTDPDPSVRRAARTALDAIER